MNYGFREPRRLVLTARAGRPRQLSGYNEVLPVWVEKLLALSPRSTNREFAVLHLNKGLIREEVSFPAGGQTTRASFSRATEHGKLGAVFVC